MLIVAVVGHSGWWLSWFTHVAGISSETGPWYAFWSGLGSDIAEVAILGGVWSLYRKHTCHVDRCWRISRHPVAGTPYIVCRKHHPTVPATVTHDHIKEAHSEVHPQT